MRLTLQNMYEKAPGKIAVWRRFKTWVPWVRKASSRAKDSLLASMVRLADMIERRLDGIVALLEPKNHQRLHGGPQQRLLRRPTQGPRRSDRLHPHQHALLRRQKTLIPMGNCAAPPAIHGKL